MEGVESYLFVSCRSWNITQECRDLFSFTRIFFKPQPLAGFFFSQVSPCRNFLGKNYSLPPPPPPPPPVISNGPSVPNATFIERQKAILIMFFIIFVNCFSLLFLPIFVILGTVTNHVKGLQQSDQFPGKRSVSNEALER